MAFFSGAGSEGFVWVVPPTGIIDNIKKMRRRTIDNARRELDAFAVFTEGWMKDNHPWNNDTQTAENSLTAITDANGDVLFMDIGYDLGILQTHPDGRARDYSIYLEGYLNLGILQPTKNIVFPQFTPKLSGKLSL